MKTKAKKRLEAIQRLEQATIHSVHHGNMTVEHRQEIVDKRHAEAKRLREAFKL